MNYTRLSVFVGAALLSVAASFSAAPAYASQGYYRSYQVNQGGYQANRAYYSYRTDRQVNRGYQTYGAYGQAGRGYPGYRPYPQTTRGDTTYRPYNQAYQQHTPAYRRGVTTPQRFARGGGSGMATFYDPAPAARGFTAAHLSLPMGTRIMVTNLSNRRSVVVRIADRGPEAWTGRILDMSRAAAYSLGMIQAGVVPISYRVVN